MTAKLLWKQFGKRMGKIMVIEVESVYGDKLIHGRHLERRELEKAFKEILQIIPEKDFLSAFCVRYGYEELLYCDTIRVDYTLDLDTHMLCKPRYCP